MDKQIETVKQLAAFAAETYGDKDFCRFIREGEICVKSYKRFYEDCLAVSRYIRSVKRDRMHIAFIGKTSYEYIVCLTGMIFSGNVVVPFSPDISVEEGVELFTDADIEMVFCEEELCHRAGEISDRIEGISQVVSLGNWQ